MRTIGYCEHCRKVKNVTISPSNLMLAPLIGICDDCAAELEPPAAHPPRDRADSAQPPTVGRANTARRHDETTSPHQGEYQSPEDTLPQLHSHASRPVDRTLPANDSPTDPSRFDSDPALDMLVEVTCDTCRTTETFQVNRARFTAWSDRRMPIQHALAHLSIPNREFVKSRICPTCWIDMFGPGPFGA
ncbi:hypothetical protein ACWIGW_40915 [Nocardia brasiliensis]